MDERFPKRKNPRLRQFDYASANSYFVTICTWEKACLFGTPETLSPYGIIAREYLEEIPLHYPEVVVEQMVVMPNHVHAIMTMPGDGSSLPTVIGGYKSAVSRKIRQTAPDLKV